MAVQMAVHRCPIHDRLTQKNGVCQSCYFRAWYERNRDDVKARAADWKKENRPAHLEGKRRWAKRHGDRLREAKRRFLVRSRGGEVIPYRETDIYERDGWVCHICRLSIDPHANGRSSAGPTLDHLIAISQGGSDTAENVRPAHKGCNSRRWNREQRAA